MKQGRNAARCHWTNALSWAFDLVSHLLLRQPRDSVEVLIELEYKVLQAHSLEHPVY